MLLATAVYLFGQKYLRQVKTKRAPSPPRRG